jgi:poly(3-hydroxybutyrate) depolymerase
MFKMTLLPGSKMTGMVPMDGLKSSDCIVNDLGGNTQVYPKKLQEFRETLVGGAENVWYEYLPDSYDGTQAVPLVISCHGGGMDGWGQCIFTSWTMVAERENFIAVFPTAGKQKAWQVNLGGEPIDKQGNQDILFILALIDRLKQKYKIDTTRIYMQGMSMGDLMTMQFSRAYGNLLAAAANSAGPTSPSALYDEDGKLKEYVCPVPVYQFRGEMDNTSIFPAYTRPEVNSKNRNFWKQINACHTLPEISIAGFDNVAYYKGDKADFIYRDVKFRGHGQPLDDAEYAWRYLFSGCRRLPSGALERGEPIERPGGDKNAIALAEGKNKAYIDNQLAELDAAPFVAELKAVEMITNKLVDTYHYLYVSVKTLCRLFEMTCEISKGTAVIRTKDGRTLQVAAESIGCVVDNRLYSMSRQCEVRDGVLYVPVRWFAESLFNRFVTELDGAMYIADHVGYMTHDTAVILKEILE